MAIMPAGFVYCFLATQTVICRLYGSYPVAFYARQMAIWDDSTLTAAIGRGLTLTMRRCHLGRSEKSDSALLSRMTMNMTAATSHCGELSAESNAAE
ncbi:hypothetical protein BDP55DRAFT_652452 [Colletotrichum godetiae]|uniref:Uncharacterized protein n=1 Tax=Colletotrichum godetiae TaxID=1209918 RepID=A0AAJ0ATE1_9PEZI|nr:uncharacterized protein BDP55DRAFT_652452 [Colletotrichum godetiae]KAK1690015.1 hypothetical protein BDP55DRAFT_652452 [Colletotrichum godetiae]